MAGVGAEADVQHFPGGLVGARALVSAVLTHQGRVTRPAVPNLQVVKPTTENCKKFKGSFTRCVSYSVKEYTIEVYVAVEVIDESEHVNRSICCHRSHCLRDEKIDIVVDVVALCELSSRPVHMVRLRLRFFIATIWGCLRLSVIVSTRTFILNFIQPISATKKSQS